MNESEFVESSASEGVESPSAAPEPSAAAVSSPAQPTAAVQQQPQQPQGPDWNSLGVPFDQAQQRLQYFQELEQRYRSDPAFAQQYDRLYGGQQPPQQHPYDWMVNADDQYRQQLREQGEQHPDFPRYQQEFGNFFQNPIGQLAQYATHPKVVESIYGALQPQVQDLARRMMEQEMAPIKQYLQQQGEQQFRQQYESAWAGLPEAVKQIAMSKIQQGADRHQVIKDTVDYAKSFQSALPPPGAQGAAPSKPGSKPPQQPPKSPTNKNASKHNEEFIREYAAALSGEK